MSPVNRPAIHRVTEYEVNTGRKTMTYLNVFQHNKSEDRSRTKVLTDIYVYLSPLKMLRFWVQTQCLLSMCSTAISSSPFSDLNRQTKAALTLWHTTMKVICVQCLAISVVTHFIIIAASYRWNSSPNTGMFRGTHSDRVKWNMSSLWPDKRIAY